MPLNINPNYDSNNPTILFNTQIPALTDDADIQEALRLYHYGTTTPPALPTLINPESVAGYLKSLREDITALEELGIGSSYSNTLPTNVPDGYVWVNSDSAAPIFDNILLAAYQAEAPTNDLAEGLLWVDSDDNTLYVYNGISWDAISSSGGSSFTPPTTSRLDLFGVADVTAPAGQPFYYLDGAVPTSFSVNTLVTSYTKTEVSVNTGIQFSVGAVGPISLVRVVNGDLANPVVLGNYNHTNNVPLSINFVDEHGQAPGTVLTYGLANYTNAPGGTPGDITFLSIGAIQISCREVA
jgi:hypothetical protein